MDAVKLEGGRAMAGTVRAITDAGMAVVGHIGLTPQSAAQLGGYRVQGKTAADAGRLLDDALALEAAGAVMIVLEMVPIASPSASRGGCASRRSASAQAWGATARCWCCTTCWGSSTASRRSSSRSTPSSSRRWRPRWLPIATTWPAAISPMPRTASRWRTRSGRRGRGDKETRRQGDGERGRQGDKETGR